MASPIVSGIVSLLKGYDSSLDNDDIQRIIEISADEVPGYVFDSNGWNDEMGYGRVNAYEALKRLQSPYILEHHTASGGYTHSSSGKYTLAFYGLPYHSDGAYTVKRYEVRKTVNFSWLDEAYVWGRGVDATGYSNQIPNFTMGYTDVVSHTNNSATLRTYVYEVWTTLGQPVGWFPTSPSNVEFTYTVHGITGIQPPSVFINGPTVIQDSQGGQWTANVSGGVPPYSYQWSRSFDSGSTWISTGSNSQSYSGTYIDDFILRVQVTDDNSNTAQGGKSILVTSGDGCIMCKRASLPQEFSLNNNYPNPFNPSTKISYALPEASEVSLKIYNVMGQQARPLLNSSVNAGFHEVTFDAQQLPSGFYIARMEAIGQSGKVFTKELKMQLIK